jgi:hypothetical protein
MGFSNRFSDRVVDGYKIPQCIIFIFLLSVMCLIKRD